MSCGCDASLVSCHSVEERGVLGVCNKDVKLRCIIQRGGSTGNECSKLKKVLEEMIIFCHRRLTLFRISRNQGRWLIVENRVCLEEDILQSTVSIAVTRLHDLMELAILGEHWGRVSSSLRTTVRQAQRTDEQTFGQNDRPLEGRTKTKLYAHSF